MNWLQEAFLEPTMVQAVIIISLVSALGLYLGRIKIFGISLGITFVFFAGILAGHLGIVVNKDMLYFAQSFGLILFVYALGLQVGPGFFSSLKKGGVAMNMMGLGVILLGLIMTVGLHWVTGVSLSNMVGLLCGAVTNTPALGAAQQALLQIDPANTKGVTDMALACAVAYPLGVVGVILAIIILRALFADKKQKDLKEQRDTTTYVAEFHVSNPAIYEKSIKDVMKLTDKHFVISRVWRNGKVSIPTSDTLLHEHDHLLIISVKSDVENIKVLFGEQENVDWNKADIDWNAIDSQLISRRIAVTRNRVNGVKLGSLRLRNLYGINITRVNRAGIDLLASPDLRLQIGDRLTIVGEANSVNTVGKILGDEIKRLNNPNLLAVFIGISLGMLLGALPITLPGMSTPVKLGIAGGPIIVGILMGAFGPRFHLTTYTTMSANLMLREIGISIFLACVGLGAGEGFVDTVIHGGGYIWVGYGVIITILPLLITGLIGRYYCKLNYFTLIGVLAGSTTNPPALAYSNDLTSCDAPAVGYATVYPLTMFLRVLTAQILILSLG